MTDSFKKMRVSFMKILKDLGLKRETIIGIAALLTHPTEMSEIVNRLEARDFKTTPEETERICCEVIRDYHRAHQDKKTIPN